MHSVRRWLEDLGLGKYVETFEAAEIQVDVLPHLTEADLKDLGLPLGPRRRILSALATSTSALPSGQRSPIVSPRTVAHEPERRHLTVLFCDLVGSTELSQRHDPEDLRDIVCQFASKRDPLFASNRDPSWTAGMGLSP
jgi:class 3 adenylate cyclase